MSLDNALRAIAYTEAPTLGVAIATIAKHRIDVDMALRAAELRQAPVATDGAAEQRAIDAVAAATDTLHAVNKVA